MVNSRKVIKGGVIEQVYEAPSMNAKNLKSSSQDNPLYPTRSKVLDIIYITDQI